MQGFSIFLAVFILLIYFLVKAIKNQKVPDDVSAHYKLYLKESEQLSKKADALFLVFEKHGFKIDIDTNDYQNVTISKGDYFSKYFLKNNILMHSSKNIFNTTGGHFQQNYNSWLKDFNNSGLKFDKYRRGDISES